MKKKNNGFASIMSASLLLASTSTLLINATEQANARNANDLNQYAISNKASITQAPNLKNMSFKQYGEVLNTVEPIKKENKVSKSNKAIKKSSNNSSKSKKSNEKSYKIFDDFSKEDRFILYRIVEAEAGDGNIQAKKNVAHVIFNRLKSKKFANNVHDVVFDKHQFSPISDGRYWKVTIADSTKDAVIKAYEEGDTTGGALYFANMKYVSNAKTRAWFNSMKYLFTDSINHSFYK